MKTLSVHEASCNLAKVLKQAIAGEDIGIRSEDSIVALRPLPHVSAVSEAELVPPRDALKWLQGNARLTAAEAERYLEEVRAERLAASENGAR